MIVVPPLVGLGVLAGQLWWGVSSGEVLAAASKGRPAKVTKVLDDWRRRGVWRSPPELASSGSRTGPREPHYLFAHDVLPWLARRGFLARYLEAPDDDWLLINWMLAEDRAGSVLRPEGLGRQRLHAGDRRVDVVRMPRAERELEAMFVGFAEDAGELRVFTLEHPVGGAERFVLAELTPRQRRSYGDVDALSAKEFVELIGEALAGEVEPLLVVDLPEAREPVAAGASSGRGSRGSGRVVFD